MAHADVTVLPLGTESTSLSSHIAEVQRVLAAQDSVRYALHAMGTTLEGDIADIYAVLAQVHEAAFAGGAERAYFVIKIDDRRDGTDQSLDDKVASVQRLLG